jgi:hypothetical protein
MEAAFPGEENKEEAAAKEAAREAGADLEA